MPRSTHPAPDLGREYLLDRLRWFVRLRWLAVFGTLFAGTAGQALGMLDDLPAITVIAFAMAMANATFQHRLGAMEVPSVPRLQAAVFRQLLVDVAALTALLHFSDSVENPFSMFLVFPLALAGQLLPRNRALTLAAAGIAMHGGTVLLEHLGLLDHHQLVLGEQPAHTDEVIESGMYTAGYLAAITVTLTGTVLFMSSTAERLGQAIDRRIELERLSASRERLAHVGELTAGLAHALRNPIHGLQNCVDLIRPDLPDSDDAQETVQLMDEGLARMAAITHRLLTLSRNAPGSRQRVLLQDLVDTTIHFVIAGAGSGRATVEQLDTPPVYAEVDADRIEEALANVVGNAIDASSPDRRITVQVRASADGTEACIEVSDEAGGIPPDVLERIFDPFFTTKPIGEGTGLGLAITRKILEEHGGRVDLESTPGAGTTVRLCFPLASPAQDLLER